MSLLPNRRRPEDDSTYYTMMNMCLGHVIGQAVPNIEELINNFYEDTNIDFGVKIDLALQTLMLPVSRQWGYLYFDTPQSLAKVAGWHYMDLENAKVAVLNPHWNLDNLPYVFRTPQEDVEDNGMMLFFIELPESILTEEVLIKLLKMVSAPKFQGLPIQSALCVRARQRYDIDGTVPDSWVLKSLVGNKN